MINSIVGNVDAPGNQSIQTSIPSTTGRKTGQPGDL